MNEESHDDDEPGSRRHLFAVALAALLAAILNSAYLDFPLGFHADEPVKVESILTGSNNFYHPLLMLQIVRAANVVLRLEDPVSVVLLGRALMALCGVVTVVLMFLLARRLLSPALAAGVALAVAVSPTLAVHAHYLKEDTVLTMSLVAASLAFLGWVDQSTRSRAILLAIATGMALSSHYKATLLILLFLVAPFVGAGEFSWAWYRRLHAVLAGSAAVFLVINWPLLLDPAGFVAGALSEANHAVVGEDALIRWKDHYLGFHLTRSLAPGMTWAAVLLGAFGVVLTVVTWRRASVTARWLVMFIAVFYLVHEVSPLKPWPDYSRYVMPTVPMLLLLAGVALRWCLERAPGRAAESMLVALGLLGGFVWPLYRSAWMVHGIGHDTRTRAAEWIVSEGGTVVADRYALDRGVAPAESVMPLDPADLTASLDPRALARDGVDFLAVSSFVYERFAAGAALPDQPPEVHAAHQRFEELFTLPYREFAPDYRSFAFSNPVVRIIELRAIRGEAPPP